MKNRGKIAGLVIISVVFEIFLGNWSFAYGLGGAGSVTGGMVSGCAGVAGSNTSLKLGGREIPPQTILRVPDGQACTGSETILKLASYTSTILVSANNAAAVNGANLRAALASVTPPDANHGVLIKLEPGVYDLGTTSLTMKAFMDLEGSGEDLTTISGSVTTTGFPIDNGLVSGASNSEIRFLTVDNQASGSIKASAIFAGNGITNFKISHVTARASSGSGTGFEEAVQNNGGSILIQYSTLEATGTGSSGSGAFSQYTAATQTQILDSSLTGTSSAIGMYNPGGTLIIKNSTLKGGTFSIATSTTNGTVNVGASQLNGAVSSIISKCAASYKSDFTAVSATCQ